VAFYHVERRYIPYFTKNEKVTFLFIILFIIKEMVTKPLACYAKAIVQRAVIYLLFRDASSFARNVWRYIVTSCKHLFKRLYIVND
jgi:hypothetical protein